jgi:quinol monooxygenase YgiN
MKETMYGMSGKLEAQPGKRQELIEILLRAADIVGMMPGCRLYAVAQDLNDETAIWAMEIWDDKNSHDGSLKDDRVRNLISEAVPLMAGKPEGVELKVIGGYGIKRN